jgi:hypothetical protein
MTKPGYNDRLFSANWRGWLHLARFRWINKMYKRYSPLLTCVSELGCFDGRALNFIPEPVCYFGFDAGWEGGLAAAQLAYTNHDKYRFIECRHPDQYVLRGNKSTLFLSLETLEHIPVTLLEGYLKKIAEQISSSGYLFISVPNEKGLLFLSKFLVKKLLLDGVDKYTISEILWITIGRCDRVARNEHKGFDWLECRNRLSAYFDLIETSGIQFSCLPLWLNPSIGFVFKARTRE